MNIERVVLIPPTSPRSKGDERMLCGAVALLEGFPFRIVSTEPGLSWVSVLREAGCKTDDRSEIVMPIPYYRSELRGGDLLLVVGADVVDGTCRLEPTLSRIDLMATATLHVLPDFVTCSFRSHVDRSIIQRLRLLPEIRFLIRGLHSLEDCQRLNGLAAGYYPICPTFRAQRRGPSRMRRARHLVPWVTNCSMRLGAAVASPDLHLDFVDESSANNISRLAMTPAGSSVERHG